MPAIPKDRGEAGLTLARARVRPAEARLWRKIFTHSKVEGLLWSHGKVSATMSSGANKNSARTSLLSPTWEQQKAQ